MIFAEPAPSHKYLQQLPQIPAPVRSLQLLMGLGLFFQQPELNFKQELVEKATNKATTIKACVYSFFTLVSLIYDQPR